MTSPTPFNSETSKLLIFGGTGFFGRAILRQLKEHSSQGLSIPTTYVFSRDCARFVKNFPEFKELKWLNFLSGDVLNHHTFPKDNNFDFIIHAAADSVTDASPLDRSDQILTGTRNILEWATLPLKKKPRFLYISSGAVYGTMPPSMGSFVESYQGAPDVTKASSAYGNAKRSAEQLCSLFYAEGKVDPIIARCFCFVGRDMPLSAHFAVGNFIYDAIYNNEIVVKGSGNSVRSYMVQSDLADWLLTILALGKPNDIYNVGSDNSISIKSLAVLVRDLLAPNKTIIFGNSSACSDSRYIPQVTKANKELGLKTKGTIETEILKIASFLNKGKKKGK